MAEARSPVFPRRYIIYTTAALIAFLLFANIFFMYQTQKVIQRNIKNYEQAEAVKVNTLDIIRTLHQMDMGLRGYALIASQDQRRAATDGFTQMDSIFARLERTLSSQDFPLEVVQNTRDSITWYLGVVSEMIQMVDEGNTVAFNNRLRDDLGFLAYKAYVTFSNKVDAFETNIATKAQSNYQTALTRRYLIQILLFSITAPALFFMVTYFNNTIKISEKLRQAEENNVRLLETRKDELERQVHERTREILTQNEEISAQNEEIVAHNEQLVLQQAEILRQRNAIVEKSDRLEQAYNIIENQKAIIEHKNDELILEVASQTRELKESNLELVEQNNRLEQFAYIISHNLRAPMARIVGLSALLEKTDDLAERDQVVSMITRSTKDFEGIFKDLSMILTIQKSQTEFLTEINLDDIMAKVLDVLKEEIKNTSTTITVDFSQASVLFSLPQYVESILYNLTSNAIKYRHPERPPRIDIRTHRNEKGTILNVSDNGIGIDLNVHRDNIFNLYKRFHFHVEGKGLGLFLVRTQVEALGGKIEVSSELDVGSTFTILFV